MNTNGFDIERDQSDWWFACVDIKVLRDKKLSQTARLIFALLCTFLTPGKRTCWPSNETVAESAGVSARTVSRAYQELEARGVITRSDRFKEEGSQTSSYTRIVGHKAKCYDGMSEAAIPHDIDDIPPMTPMTYKGYQVNNIKDSLTGEAELPSPEEFPEMPDEYSPEDAPDIMKPTAEYLLLKTGRESLTWEEISALREFAVNQYPSRVQKEIDKASERFRRKNRDLKTLTFAYIAGSLKHQPTRNRQKLKVQSDPMSMTSAEIDEANSRNAMSDSEMQYWLEKCERECV